MKKYITLAIILCSILILNSSGCSRAVKSVEQGRKDSPDNIDPFDFGDEFNQKITIKPNLRTDENKSREKSTDESSKASSITSDYQNDLQKREETNSSKPSLNVNILGYRIQIGAFEYKENAEKIAESARSKLDLPVYIIYQAPFYRVRVGDFKEKGEAEKYVKIIMKKGFNDARWVPTSINIQQ